MSNKKKSFILFVLALVSVVLLFPENTCAAESSELEEAIEILETPENYSEYLRNYTTEDALSLGVSPEYVASAVKDALVQLKEFQALDYNQQVEFLNSMKNPFLSSEEKVIEDPLPPFSILASNSRTVSYTSTLSSFGINWTTYKVSGTYTYNSTGTLKAGSTSGIVVRNLNPMVQASKTSSYGSVSNKKYTGIATFDYKIGPFKGLSVQLGTYNLRVIGRKDGRISGSAWEN